jgi:RHO1 GDP-GTP exchange protein 1/2
LNKLCSQMATRHRSHHPHPHPNPHIAIPPGAAPPATVQSQSPATWDFHISDHHDDLNLWDDDYRNTTFTPDSPETSRPHIVFPIPNTVSRPASRAASVHESGSPRATHPEPHLFRTSLRPSVSNSHLGHRSTKSETNVVLTRSGTARGESRPPSFISSESSSPEVWPLPVSYIHLYSLYPTSRSLRPQNCPMSSPISRV